MAASGLQKRRAAQREIAHAPLPKTFRSHPKYSSFSLQILANISLPGVCIGVELQGELPKSLPDIPEGRFVREPQPRVVVDHGSHFRAKI